MGNLCGKSSRDDDPFTQPGRLLGSTDSDRPEQARSHVPHSTKSNKDHPSLQTQGRVLGSYAANKSAKHGVDQNVSRKSQVHDGQTHGPLAPSTIADPRAAAAKAAEASFLIL